MEITIRRVIENDFSTITKLKKAEWGIYDNIENHCLEVNPNDHLYVAIVNNEIAAIQGYEIINLDNLDFNKSHMEKFMYDKYSYLFNKRDKICFLHSAITCPKYRYQGIAKKLFNFLLTNTIDNVNYYILDALQRKDGSVPSKKLVDHYDFSLVGYEKNVWSHLFDGINTICADCGPGKICSCSTYIYYYDVIHNKETLLDKIKK